MISRVEGKLIAVEEGRAEVARGSMCFEILVPGYDQQRLATFVGETVRFHTLHYLEGQGQGTSFIPRLIGFSTAEERAFFTMFTTVKGLGNRKALRALQLPFSRVAEAIAGKDVDLLKSLPEIGRRTAETIVAELHGKVDRFIEVKPQSDAGQAGPAAVMARDAVEVLTRLGEPKAQARDLVDRAIRADPEIDTTEALIAAAFQLRE